MSATLQLHPDDDVVIAPAVRAALEALPPRIGR
jgi:hypothetical protein